jgi:hypothetical protein
MNSEGASKVAREMPWIAGNRDSNAVHAAKIVWLQYGFAELVVSRANGAGSARLGIIRIPLMRTRWTNDEVDVLKAATSNSVLPGTIAALSKRLGRSSSQVSSKIARMRVSGKMADSPRPTGKRWVRT